MLQKENRLPAQIRLKNSSFFKTPLFTLKVSQNNLTISRYGFVVRKAVDKRAVARNRIRRVFRSCIEELSGQIKSGNDMLFLLEKGIIEKTQAELCLELKNFLAQKDLLNA